MIGAQHRGRERRLRRADGETIWVRTTASIVHREGRLAYAIAHIADITAAKRAEEELTGQALHDPLTGLANRNLLMDHVGLALDQLRRNDDAVAVLYLDLDRFKDVNDKHGHEVGDEVLSEVGARLAATVRAPDTAARLGGDEFVVVCTGITDDLAATGIADRLEAALAEPVRVDGAELEVGASIGVTTTRWSSTDPDELLRQADMAMYQAKRNGRHRWERYDQSFRNHALARLSVQSDLRAAIDEHWLRLHYQPVVDLTDGRIVGCEALLRIAHPERGLLYPDAFIDVAENSDLIVPIGDWVLREACAQLSRWRPPSPFRMAVNVSGRQVAAVPIAARVLAAAADANVDPTGLVLEMTERVLIEAGDPKLGDLRRLADHGVGIAIDDFGTGYSSLTYLKQLPVDAVKIDRSFVKGLGVSAQDTAIIEAITALTGALGLTAIAEGVESEQQLAIVRDLGCQRAQGFLFGRPVPADELTRVLETRGVLAVPTPARAAR